MNADIPCRIGVHAQRNGFDMPRKGHFKRIKNRARLKGPGDGGLSACGISVASARVQNQADHQHSIPNPIETEHTEDPPAEECKTGKGKTSGMSTVTDPALRNRIQMQPYIDETLMSGLF